MDIITTVDNNINLMNTTTAVTPTVPPMPEDLFKFLHNYSSPNAAVCFKMWVYKYSIKVKVVVTSSWWCPGNTFASQCYDRGSSPGGWVPAQNAGGWGECQPINSAFFCQIDSIGSILQNQSWMVIHGTSDCLRYRSHRKLSGLSGRAPDL